MKVRMAVVGVVATAAWAWPMASASPDPIREFGPCAEEDSPGPCHWDARTRGNGEGRSFVVLEDQSIIYLEER